jgi:glycosyltransferase involved in cell wall biosynthesis
LVDSDELQYEVTPVISVILPVYNGGKYIVEAIESILKQTFSDFELIVIDDGSTDDTFRILQKYQAKDQRIRVVSRKNKGLIATLNEGISLAKGIWIARMDADDIALAHRFERQLERLDNTGADICGSWVKRFGTVDKRIVMLHQSDGAIKKEMLFCSPFVHPSVMLRTSVMKHLLYDTAWEKAEDYDLWERAIEMGCKMTNVPEILLLYRVHKEQISTQFASFQQEQGRGIRRRYWMFVFNAMSLNQDWVDETLKIFTTPLVDINMDIVDEVFAELLKQSDDESRKVIFSHMTRLYLLVAAQCPNIVYRWTKLNQDFGLEKSLFIRIKLLLFRWLRVRENDFIYNFLKKLYLLRGRSE